MIILDAIDKAKRIRQERTRRPDKSDASPGSAKAWITPESESIPIPRLTLPRYAFDEQVCEQNRILVSSNSDRSYSAISDAYRILRTRLWGQIQSDKWNSIAVTSAGPGEGKSVTALNLSLAMAIEKKRNVFLLDLDLRNPSLVRYLGVNPQMGIGSYLVGECNAEDILFSIGVDNLAVAGGMTSYEHSAELLGSNRLQELIGYIQHLDPNALIIADLPPLLSTADALVVAPKMSATLLVVAEGVTRRDGLNRAVDVLSGVNVAGIVLNHAREAIASYYG